MILQTIQHKNVLLDLNANGIILANKINNPNYNIDFQDAYDWMKSQMLIHNIFPKNNENELLWAWAYSGDNNKKEVDIKLREEELKDSVLITFEKNESEILLSEFESWHYVLNYWVYITSKEEEIYWENITKKNINNYYTNKPLLNKSLDEQLKKTWEITFKIRESKNKFIWDLPKNIVDFIGYQELCVQATMWNIKKSEIISIF